MKHLPFLFMANLLITAACVPIPDDDGDNPNTSPKPSNATRSPTCVAWQDATCDYLVDRCGLGPRAECDEDIGSTFCNSDETVNTCVALYASGTCPDLPDACQDVADQAPAIWYCETFVDTLCTRGEACGIETKASCISGAANSLDCDEALGADPAIETCLATLKAISCESLSSLSLPAKCQNVIKIYKAASSHAPVGHWATPMFHRAVRFEFVQSSTLR